MATTKKLIWWVVSSADGTVWGAYGERYRDRAEAQKERLMSTAPRTAYYIDKVRRASRPEAGTNIVNR